MKGVIELSGGDFKCINCTAYISKKYTLDGRTLDPSLLDRDRFILASGVENMHLTSAMSKGDESFLWLELLSPFANIDSIKVNVPIKITATFGVFGWAQFYLFRLYKRLKGDL